MSHRGELVEHGDPDWDEVNFGFFAAQGIDHDAGVHVEWEPNTLTFWDNRCTQHHAVWDYYPYSRRGERVSIVGEKRPSR
jgi:alpha-ketoglutarate-dependent taurine dioxygenase